MSSDSMLTPTAGVGSRWSAAAVVCLAVLMVVVSGASVSVALPSIRAEMRCSDAALTWVSNAFMIAAAAFLMLGGRLSDLYGRRKLFILGICLFAVASLVCAEARSLAVLIAGRAAQGVGAAVMSVVAISIIMALFSDTTRRSIALAVYGGVNASGLSIGMLVGGVLTTTLSWRWIFLANFPLAVAIGALSLVLLPRERLSPRHLQFDIWGAIAITSSLLLIVWALVSAADAAWNLPRTLGLLGGGIASLIVAIAIETHVTAPLAPPRIFAQRGLVIASTVALLWSASTAGWYFYSALYMQRVLGHTPMQVAVAFLPATLTSAAFAFGLSAALVKRFDARQRLTCGLVSTAFGLALFSFAPTNAQLMIHFAPVMFFVGMGSGLALNPLLVSAVHDVDPGDLGIASALVNTATRIGAPLGLALFACVASWRTESALMAGAILTPALASGYRAAFLLAAIFAAIAALLSATSVRPPSDRSGAAVADCAASGSRSAM